MRTNETRSIVEIIIEKARRHIELEKEQKRDTKGREETERGDATRYVAVEKLKTGARARSTERETEALFVRVIWGYFH